MSFVSRLWMFLIPLCLDVPHSVSQRGFSRLHCEKICCCVIEGAGLTIRDCSSSETRIRGTYGSGACGW